MSTFKDELNEVTKTPEQVLNEQWNAEQKNIIATATNDYKCIKNELLKKAKNGQYLDLGGKKLVFTNYKSDYVSKSIKRVDNSTYIPKIFGKGNHILGHVEYTIKNQNAYNLYIETLQNLAIEDEISITPTFISQTYQKQNDITLPYVYTGEYNISNKVFAHLRCSIKY